MATYPTGTYAPAAVSNGQTIDAGRDNAQDAEITAIEDALRTAIPHAVTISTGGLTVSTGNVSLGQNLSVAGTSTFAGKVTLSTQISAPSQPRCQVYSTAAQSLAADAWTAVTFESEEYDVGSLHSTASNPSRITVPAGSSGLFLFGAAIRTSTGGPVQPVSLRFLKNSTTEVGPAHVLVRSSVSAQVQVHTLPIVIGGDDFIEVEMFPTTSTGSIPAAGTVRRAASEFWCVKLW